MAKGVLFPVIRSPNKFVPSHVPENWERAPQEDQLHDSIIKWDKISKNIQIAWSKYKSIELLCLQWNACKRKKEEMSHSMHMHWNKKVYKEHCTPSRGSYNCLKRKNRKKTRFTFETKIRDTSNSNKYSNLGTLQILQAILETGIRDCVTHLFVFLV